MNEWQIEGYSIFIYLIKFKFLEFLSYFKDCKGSTKIWIHVRGYCCVFLPTNACLHMLWHGRKKWKTFKNVSFSHAYERLM